MDRIIVRENDIYLRCWSEGDLDALIILANNINIAKYLTNKFPHPYREKDGKAFLSYATSNEANKIFAIEYNGQLAGGIGLHPQDDIFCRNAELGYWLGQPYWGKGIMTACVNRMVEWGFSNLKVDRIFARPFSNNPGSRKVLENCNFELEAILKETILKNEEVLDELIFAMRR